MVVCGWTTGVGWLRVMKTPRKDLLATISKFGLAWVRKRVVVDEPSGGESSGGGKRRPGRPPKATDPASSAAAALGTELRRLRIDRGLTRGQLGRLVGYSGQHLGAVERGTAVPSEVVVLACDAAVGEWPVGLDVTGPGTGRAAGVTVGPMSGCTTSMRAASPSTLVRACSR